MKNKQTILINLNSPKLIERHFSWHWLLWLWWSLFKIPSHLHNYYSNNINSYYNLLWSCSLTNFSNQEKYTFLNFLMLFLKVNKGLMQIITFSNKLCIITFVWLDPRLQQISFLKYSNFKFKMIKLNLLLITTYFQSILRYSKVFL